MCSRIWDTSTMGISFPVQRSACSRNWRRCGLFRFGQLLLVVGLILAYAWAPAAHAEEYPSRPITLVVPYTAGGGNDAMARVVADRMSKTLRQQIVIENRGGAGGTIATRS